MEIYQLRYFVAVAQAGSFSRAAEQCHISQPSLSQQIAKLEKHLRQRLFHRLGRKVILTDAGQILLEKAMNILTAIDDTEREMRDGDSEQESRLTVGAIPTIAPYLLPTVLESFMSLYSNVELTVHEDVTQRLLEATAAGEIDLAIVALPVNDDRLIVESLLSEPLLLALPREHHLEERTQVTLNDLREERFIMLNEMHCLSDQIMSFCRTNDYVPRIGCRSAQITTVQALIGAGQGVSLLPAMARETDDSGAVYRLLSSSELMRTVAVIWHRHRYHSFAEQQFLSELRATSRVMEAGFIERYGYAHGSQFETKTAVWEPSPEELEGDE